MKGKKIIVLDLKVERHKKIYRAMRTLVDSLKLTIQEQMSRNSTEKSESSINENSGTVLGIL